MVLGNHLLQYVKYIRVYILEDICIEKINRLGKIYTPRKFHVLKTKKYQVVLFRYEFWPAKIIIK